MKKITLITLLFVSISSYAQEDFSLNFKLGGCASSYEDPFSYSVYSPVVGFEFSNRITNDLSIDISLGYKMKGLNFDDAGLVIDQKIHYLNHSYGIRIHFGEKFFIKIGGYIGFKMGEQTIIESEVEEVDNYFTDYGESSNDVGLFLGTGFTNGRNTLILQYDHGLAATYTVGDSGFKTRSLSLCWGYQLNR